MGETACERQHSNRLATAVHSTNCGGAKPTRLLAHTIALLVVLVAVFAFVDKTSIGFPDEGAYAAQAASLADRGTWIVPLVAPSIDPLGERSASTGSVIVKGGTIPYARQPLYPLLLSLPLAIGGISGMMFVSLIGSWIAALASAGIATEIHPSLAIPTLWAVGIGSPILFDAYIVVGHSLVAATAAVATLALLRCWDVHSPPRVRAGWTFTAILASALSVLLRSEGVVVMGLLGLAALVCSFERRRSHFRVDWFRAATGIALTIAVIATYQINGRLAAEISEGANTGGGDVHRITDPVRVAWVSLIRPWTGDNRNASAAMAFVVAGSIAGPVLLRLLRYRPLLPVCIFIATAVGAVAHLFDTQDLISGLLAATPILPIGWLLLPVPRRWSRTLWILVGTVVSSSCVIVWTSYADGGATEWGGRFLHILIPLAVPVAVLGIWNGTRDAETWVSKVVIGSVITISLALGISSVRVVNRYHHAARAVVEGTAQLIETADLPADSLIVYADLTPSGSSRIFWEVTRFGGRVINAPNLRELTDLLPYARRDGKKGIVVVTNADRGILQYALDETGLSDSWEIVRVVSLRGSSTYAAVLQFNTV